MKGRIWAAVHVLATSDATIQERLASAALNLIVLKPEELPEDLREEFVAVLHELTKQKAAGNEGTLKATTRQLTAEQSRKLAARILHIYTELHGGI